MDTRESKNTAIRLLQQALQKPNNCWLDFKYDTKIPTICFNEDSSIDWVSNTPIKKALEEVFIDFSTQLQNSIGKSEVFFSAYSFQGNLAGIHINPPFSADDDDERFSTMMQGLKILYNNKYIGKNKAEGLIINYVNSLQDLNEQEKKEKIEAGIKESGINNQPEKLSTIAVKYIAKNSTILGEKGIRNIDVVRKLPSHLTGDVMAEKFGVRKTKDEEEEQNNNSTPKLNK